MEQNDDGGRGSNTDDEEEGMHARGGAEDSGEIRELTDQ